MHEPLLIAIATVIVLGVGAQWLSWWLRLPSLLLLLLLGFLAGPVLHLLRPEEQFGDLLAPFVSLAVAMILYEGGLSLRFRELRGAGTVVWRLVTIGAGVSLVGAALAARLILPSSEEGSSAPFSWDVAILLGAILVVTGPTVIGPLLRHIRPRGAVGPVLKWEGIVIDPIGAMLAVLVFEAIKAGTLEEGTSLVLVSLIKTIAFGGGLGLVAGLMLAIMLRSYWIPDFLDNAVSVMLVVAVYAITERLQSESGLLAATVMGITLANQRFADVRHIVEFKENLRILLISALFIVLSARLELAELGRINWWRGLMFLGVLVVVARPLSVLISTVGSSLTPRERLFMSWLAPRGIVAAAVSSVFALRLQTTDSDQLVPLTFLVIVGTVVIYGLTGPLVARLLDVAEPNPQGVLMVGADAWEREVAKVLAKHGFRVLLVDTNRGNIAAARMDGLETYADSIMAEHALDELNLGGLGRLVAATSNDWVNALAAQRFSRIFNREEVYQLPPAGSEEGEVHRHLHGRWLFGQDATHASLRARILQGAMVKATPLTEAFTYESFQEHYGDRAVPMFLITAAGRLQVFTDEQGPEPKPGDTIVSLVEEG